MASDDERTPLQAQKENMKQPIQFTRSLRDGTIAVKIGDHEREGLTWDEAMCVMAAWVLNKPVPYVAVKRERLCKIK